MAPEDYSALHQWMSDHTVAAGECLEFSGYRMPNPAGTGPGYGRLTVRGKSWLAHRYVAHRLGWAGVVRHSCDNRACCNPAHLIPGTQQQNLVDRSMRSPRNARTLKLTPGQVRAARSRMTRGETATAVARDFGVTPENMMMIRAGKTWTHLFNNPGEAEDED